MQRAANNRHELPAHLRQRLVELGRRSGLRALATTIGVSPQTLASVAAGLRVNASIVALVERRLAELDLELGLSSAAPVTRAELDPAADTAAQAAPEPAETSGRSR
jgi:hypothetical protein